MIGVKDHKECCGRYLVAGAEWYGRTYSLPSAAVAPPAGLLSTWSYCSSSSSSLDLCFDNGHVQA